MAPKKVQQDKQRSTKHSRKTKGQVTRTPLKTRGELRCSGRVSKSCSTNGTHRVNLVTKPVISGMNEERTRKCLRQVEHIRSQSFAAQIFHNVQPSHGGDRKTVKVMTPT